MDRTHNVYAAAILERLDASRSIDGVPAGMILFRALGLADASNFPGPSLADLILSSIRSDTYEISLDAANFPALEGPAVLKAVDLLANSPLVWQHNMEMQETNPDANYFLSLSNCAHGIVSTRIDDLFSAGIDPVLIVDFDEQGAARPREIYADLGRAIALAIQRRLASVSQPHGDDAEELDEEGDDEEWEEYAQEIPLGPVDEDDE